MKRGEREEEDKGGGDKEQEGKGCINLQFNKFKPL